jgi:hypothetical protein
MAEIQEDIPPLQSTEPYDIAVYVEDQLRRMQREIWLLRQFLEPAVKKNEDCPDQYFNPLE